jgi:uncharacterized protein (DUF2336 family)
VFKLFKLGFGLVALAAVAWFGITVKLGPRTLFQHLRAIGETKESQELVDGTKQAAAPIVDDVRRRISGKPEAGGGAASPDHSASGKAGAPQERLSDSEQRQLRELLRKVDRAAP